MPFVFKKNNEFLSLNKDKRCYYLARLYINRDTSKKSKLPYNVRLFSCVGYLKKQPEPLLSILYNYLTDNSHDGLMIWEITPKATLYDEQRRRKPVEKVQEYKEFNQEMLQEILDEWQKGDVANGKS